MVDETSKMFTGHERDGESGLDYMLARYYGNDLPRFMSPDPGEAWDEYDPQSWNLYAYVGNNPISGIDPLGLCNEKKCRGLGRGLQGNTGLVGRQGGIPGQTVRSGTAAVIPQQFGFSSGVGLAPYASQIHGMIGGASFSGITDVMGGKSPISGENVRTAMQQLNPGQLILEIPGALDQGANAPVTIYVPNGLSCPSGTSSTGGG